MICSLIEVGDECLMLTTDFSMIGSSPDANSSKRKSDKGLKKGEFHVD